jgi:hypothetical protein
MRSGANTGDVSTQGRNLFTARLRLQVLLVLLAFKHACHLPPTRHTRPIQDQTRPVYFSRKVHHGRHIATVGTPDVLQDALLEVWGDSIPACLGFRGACWMHRRETLSHDVLPLTLGRNETHSSMVRWPLLSLGTMRHGFLVGHGG